MLNSILRFTSLYQSAAVPLILVLMEEHAPTLSVGGTTALAVLDIVEIVVSITMMTPLIQIVHPGLNHTVIVVIFHNNPTMHLIGGHALKSQTNHTE